MIGCIGRKIGMTSILTKEGVFIPVTIIKIEKNYITQIKSIEQDGYDAIQITFGNKKANRLTKPESGHFKKAGVNTGYGLWEFRIKENKEKNKFFIGQSITTEFFTNIKKVDVTGLSKGKGFAGTVKRWNFQTQSSSHGNSLSHRAPGSIGQNQTPGKVFKGKKMAGQLGNDQITIQNLEVIRIDIKRNLLIVKGSIPGANKGNLIIKSAIKTNASS
ncbi:50S ribosomal protein L3 [Sodalis sp. CWE]|uniref:50S ribosomal protein L3 n=1 Tax=Sodalis sp. CWE TaxID=2803816 RepID=UPI001C7CFBCD|nr:50S ribosomal protein L3 [Sodalis sp. CWE]MBX4180740.1 50S ribosomal protein L3 [Sodalis sp. CWE]